MNIALLSPLGSVHSQLPGGLVYQRMAKAPPKRPAKAPRRARRRGARGAGPGSRAACWGLGRRAAEAGRFRAKTVKVRSGQRVGSGQTGAVRKRPAGAGAPQRGPLRSAAEDPPLSAEAESVKGIKTPKNTPSPIRCGRPAPLCLGPWDGPARPGPAPGGPRRRPAPWRPKRRKRSERAEPKE